MDNVITLSPVDNELSIPELLRKLADDIETGTIKNARGCSIALQTENEDDSFVFDIFGWGPWVRTRADVYWSFMKAATFIL